MNPTYILVIDTATERFSLALIKNDIVIGEYLETETQHHAKKLTIEIEQLLLKANCTFKDLNAIAINEGPGSFTGLRVASSSAKGFCFSLNIPLIAIRAIEEYALNLMQNKEYNSATIMINARRNNYFYTRAILNQIENPISFLDQESILLQTKGEENPLIVKSEEETFYNFCHAKYLKSSVVNKFKKAQFEDLLRFEPNYHLNTYSSK